MKKNNGRNRKFERKDKNEKRRLVMQKQNARKEKNMMMYGAESGATVVAGKAIGFNRRLIAALLAMVFVLTTLVVGINFAAKAEVDDDGFNMLESNDNSGFVTRKGLRYNEANDTYDLRMEAYATAPIATKPYENNTPLDVVMVLDQSTTMSTKDVLTGEGYQVAEVSYQDSTAKPTFSVSDLQSGKYYYYDANYDKYYPVSVSDRDETVVDSYVPIKNSNSTVIQSWTAQQARDRYTNSGNKNLYFLNDETQDYETVYVEQQDWYRHAGNNVSVTNFVPSSMLDNWFWQYNNDAIGEFYYNTAGNINTNQPFWHRVYENTHGVTLGGFYVYLWYYRDGETSFSDGTSLAYNCSESAYNNALNAGTVVRVPNSNSYSYRSYGPYDAWDNTAAIAGNRPQSGDQNYTGGQLFTRQPANSVYNYMFTSNNGGTTEIRTLAWPLSQSNSSSNTNPGSSTYNGVLYTAGYLPYYTDDNNQRHYIGKAVFGQNENAYIVADESNVPLYEKETMTRLDAEKLAASNLAQQIAEAVTEDADHRIAVVGFNDNGTVKTNLVAANSDAVDTAITGLSASGGSSVSAGLNTSQNIFANNALDPADSRKRIVVLFTDDDAVESAAENAAAGLKDTYNASVYTIGYNKDGVSSAVDNWLDHLSSNYFSTAISPTSYTKTNDAIDYYESTTNKPTILGAFADVETASENSTTTATLGTANAVLKDIISNNFIADQAQTEVKIASATWPSGGEVSWGNPASTSLTATKNGNTYTVPGFDYSTNYVAEGHNGQKIILTITGLKLKDKVKTGTDKRIYTNEAESGIYKTGAEDLLVAKFLRPYVDNISNMAPAGGTGVASDGVVVNKYLTPNNNGKYDLTLEAYTTVTNQTKVEKVPTDFVVVVDQSGSMSTADMPTGYTAVSGGKTIEEVANGSYYIQAADGNFYRVYATRDYLYRYYPANYWFTGDIVDRLGTNLGWFMGETESTTTFANQFYFREVVNGTTYYRPITTTIEGKIGTYYMKFHYDSIATGNTVEFDRETTTYSQNGNSPWYHNLLNGNVIKSGLGWSAANAATQTLYPDDKAYTYSELASIRTGMYVNYPMYERKVGYSELRYRDVNGVEHTLAATNGQSQWEFCNASGQALTSHDGTNRPTYTGLYQASGTITRLEALKNALDDFAQAVSEESDSDGAVNNKIAIVGFSSPGYNNTEVLTNTDRNLPSANNGWQKSTADGNVPEYYGKALVDSTNGTAGEVNTKITAAIDALTANGGTQPEDGLQMANQILANRSETQYEIKYGSRAGEKVDRNTIVIFFTDGQPGDYTYSDQYAEANEVVEAALPIKQSGATVFSIGVFGESDGNPLTYTHERKTSEDPNWEYLGGWVENYHSGYYYYALRRQWRSGAEGYTPTANDTIYDYMSVTSSNYPTATDYIAPGWLNNSFSGTYTQATDGVRGGSTDTTVNNHYRMASNQDTLIAAFAQAVTMMNDTISENVRLDSSAILRDIMKDGSFVASESSIVTTSTVNGAMDKNGVVTFESTSTPVTLSQTPTYEDGVLSAVDVKGFDYLANYINYGTGTGVDDLHYHEGKKLVVTITDVYPDGADSAPSGDTLVYSNKVQNTNESSALFGVNNGSETKVQTFPEPAITRHSYTLNVGDINTDATFDVNVALVNSSGSSVDLDDDDVQDDLKDVMIVFPDGSRYNYLAVGPQVFDDMKDKDTFYFENVPQGYQIKTGVTTTDDSYVYHINFDGGTSSQMVVNEEKATNFSFDNHNINIVSERSMKNVTVWEQTIGSYADPDQVFDEVITMQIPVANGTQIPNEFRYDTTFTGEYHGYNNATLPQNADEYKAVFTWDGQPAVDGKVTATLTAIESKKGGTTYTYPTTDGLPMKHNDRVTFSVPTQTTVTVAEPETHDHDVTFYSSKDDVAADKVTFETMSGTPISGEYDMSFVSVDGIEAAGQSITFEDGVVTSTSNPIDFAPYQAITFTSDEDIGYPVLNINGTKLTFVPEEKTEGGQTQYVYTADIKRSTTGTPITATVEKDHIDILVVNEKGDIPITGIGDSSDHNWIIYILAALGGIAAIGAGIFLWKKKDEFVEE